VFVVPVDNGFPKPVNPVGFVDDEAPKPVNPPVDVVDVVDVVVVV
jgi:hypothetical protein